MDATENPLPFYPDWIDEEIKAVYFHKLQRSIERCRLLEAELQEWRNLIEERIAKTTLPPEILTQIFQRAIPPSNLLDSGLCCGPDSAWCKTLRTKMSIISVCRSWYSAGIPFLYQDVCIRRHSQLLQLWQTLKEPNTSVFARLIKSLEIQCYVPEELASDFNACFLDTLELCQSIASFSLCPSCLIPSSTLAIARWLPQSLTRLRLGNLIPYQSLIGILFEVKETLRYLALQIGLTKQENYTVLNSTKKRLKGIKLAALEELFLEIGRWSFESELLVITEFWTLPALARLSIIQGGLRSSAYSSGADDYYLTTDQIEESIINVLERHGANVTFLQIDWDWLFTGIDHAESNASLAQILQLCPLLERLVMFAAIFFQEADVVPFHLSSLRWLDLYVGRNNLCAFQDKGKSLQCLAEVFPALEGIRQFIGIPPHAREWLAAYSPEPRKSDKTHEGTSTFEIFQHRLSISRRYPTYISWDIVKDNISSTSTPPFVVALALNDNSDSESSDDSDVDYEYSSEGDDDVEESDGLELDDDEYQAVVARKGTRTQRELLALV